MRFYSIVTRFFFFSWALIEALLYMPVYNVYAMHYLFVSYLALHMQEEEEINDPILNIVQTVGRKIRTINLRQFQIMNKKKILADNVDDDDKKDSCHVCGNCKNIFGDWRTIIMKMWIIIETLVCWFCNNNLLIICPQRTVYVCIYAIIWKKLKRIIWGKLKTIMFAFLSDEYASFIINT